MSQLTAQERVIEICRGRAASAPVISSTARRIARNEVSSVAAS
jgi:hypothetical protein